MRKEKPNQSVGRWSPFHDAASLSHSGPASPPEPVQEGDIDPATFYHGTDEAFKAAVPEAGSSGSHISSLAVQVGRDRDPAQWGHRVAISSAFLACALGARQHLAWLIRSYYETRENYPYLCDDFPSLFLF